MPINMTREPTKLALLGHPVSHSLSPRLMTALARLTGRKIVYRACNIPSGRLPCAVGLLRGAGFFGANVTRPHKTAILEHLDALTPEARAIGAVNAVRCERGKLVGHNTDWSGFADALIEDGFSPRGCDALIFGAGGAARAVAYALGRLKARRVVVLSRRMEAARKLARDLGSLFPGTIFCAGRAAATDLAINATPLGMPGYANHSPAPTGWSGCKFAFDLTYGRRTAFQRQALKSGARAVGGSRMLIFQALRSWEFWFGPLKAGARRRMLKKLLCAFDS